MNPPPYPVVPYQQYFNAYPVIQYQQPPSAANGYGWHGNGYGWQLDPRSWQTAPAVPCEGTPVVEEAPIQAQKVTKQNAWVMHSQRLNLPPLNVWTVIHKEGEILSAHCDCVAGLAEACSHVGATLFAVEGAVRNHEETSVTDTKAYWMPPRTSLGAPAKVSEVDYSVCPLENLDITEEEFENQMELSEPLNDDKKQFLDALYGLERKSAILTVL